MYGEWYTPMLEPWVHYLPMDGQLNDLVAGIKWAQQKVYSAQCGKRHFDVQHGDQVIVQHRLEKNDSTLRALRPGLLLPESVDLEEHLRLVLPQGQRLAPLYHWRSRDPLLCLTSNGLQAHEAKPVLAHGSIVGQEVTRCYCAL